MQRIVAAARRFAATDLPVLLVGPTGSGKDLLAGCIHAWSGRQGAFVDLNCGAIPHELVEATLFGARRGAYTGSVEAVVGLVETADGGTLFLNEACSLPLDAQVKLLDTLETGEYRQVGDHRKRCAAFRIVAAVQDTLTAKLNAGTFRQDLFQRLAGIVLEVPPLAERPEDVIPLANHFATLLGRVLEPGAEPVLLKHSWPGNVRELRLTIERAGQLVPNGTLAPRAIVEAIGLGTAVSARWTGTLNTAAAGTLTREALLGLCQSQGWNARRVAATLGMGRTSFFRQLRLAGLTLRGLRKFAAYADVRGRVAPTFGPPQVRDG
jgi:DNA-binding NtrC family response regulator